MREQNYVEMLEGTAMFFDRKSKCPALSYQNNFRHIYRVKTDNNMVITCTN